MTIYINVMNSVIILIKFRLQRFIPLRMTNLIDGYAKEVQLSLALSSKKKGA